MKPAIGIIGCGLAANDLHYPAFEQLQDKFTIPAVCNRTLSKAEQFASRLEGLYGTKVESYSDYRDLLARDDIDAVSILLPVAQNLQVCLDAAKAGKHIFVEKPIAVDENETAQLLELEKQHPELVMMVSENFRYRPVYPALKAMLAAGEIGTPYFAQWDAWQQMTPSRNKYANTPWRTGDSFLGGFITDGGVHNVSALRDVFGEMTNISSHVFSTNTEIGPRDGLLSHFTTGGRDGIPGLTGILHLNFSVNGINRFLLTVLGTEGSIELDGSCITLFKNMDDGSISKSTSDYPDNNGYTAEYEDFVQAVRNGKTGVSTFSEASRDLHSILTAIRAGE